MSNQPDSRLKFIMDGNNYVTRNMGGGVVSAKVDINEVRSLKQELDNVNIDALMSEPVQQEATQEQITQAIDFQKSIINKFRNENTNINRYGPNDSRLKPRANNPMNNHRTREENNILQSAVASGLNMSKLDTNKDKYEQFIEFGDENPAKEKSLSERLHERPVQEVKQNPTDFSDCEMTFDEE